MSHSIEAVLFDFGMVLSGPPSPAAWKRMQSVTGLDESQLHAGYWEYRHAYDRGTHTGVEYWHLVAGFNGVVLTPAQLDELIEADTDLWTDLNLPMVEWAQALQQAGIRTGILSNIGDEMEAGVVAKLKWLERFDHRTWSHRLKVAKPELDIYRHAVSGLGVPPQSVLFIDDKEENIAAAEMAGLQAILYKDHGKFEREMAERGFSALLRPSIQSSGQEDA
jgi:putative hydrolase of the HAD superfamily